MKNPNILDYYIKPLSTYFAFGAALVSLLALDAYYPRGDMPRDLRLPLMKARKSFIMVF